MCSRRHRAHPLAGAAFLMAIFSFAGANAEESDTVISQDLQQTLRAQLTTERRAWMANLAEIAAQNIARHDTDAPLFHGSIDWHSAVHSHWTLVRYARATGDNRWDETVKKSLLREGKLAAEAVDLAERPLFEMPYGRAWFLLLVIDYELHFGSKELASLGDQVFASMQDFMAGKLGQRPSRLNDREYDNGSWALLQMLAYARHRADSAAEQEVLATTQSHRADESGMLNFADDSGPRAGFFSRCGNWLTLAAAAQSAEEFQRSLAVAAAHAGFELQPVPKLYSDHHLGMNPSRAWAIATLARRTGKERYVTAYDAHVAAMQATHLERHADYHAYGHWVPSFCMYALTEPLSMPTPPGGR